MFQGVVPQKVIAQVLSLLEAARHDEIYVCCSGTFRLERGIAQRWPSARIVSNDVSIYSTMIGRLLCEQPVDFTFKNALAPFEEQLVGASPRRRVAALLVALDTADYAKGKPNLFKQRHWAYLLQTLPTFIDKAEAKLVRAFENLKLSDFKARDWLEHVDDAIERGATIAAFPPFFKGGYETMFKFLNENIEWAAPEYAVYNPKDLHGIVQRIVDSSSDYVVLSDQLFDDPEPRATWRTPGRAPHYCYARTGTASYVRTTNSGKAFGYRRVDLSSLTADTKIELKKVDSAHALYIRSIYLKKTIEPATGMANYFIHLDGQLAGVLVYALPQFGGEAFIYLLSDVSTSRERKLSKLIARIATNKVLLDDLAFRLMRNVDYVITTAFADHPMSMKYRGLFELLSRREAHPPDKGFVLNYGSSVRDETLEEAYAWWWTKYGRLGPDRDDDAEHGSAPAEGAKAEREVHDGRAA